MSEIAEAHHEDHDHHSPGFFTRWFCSTNHKDIGTLYILLAFIAAIIGGGMSWYIRMELAAPGLQYIEDTQFYNVLVTAHGFLMVFFVVMIIIQMLLACVCCLEGVWGNGRGAEEPAAGWGLSWI